MMALAAFALATGNVKAQTLQNGVDFHGLQASGFQWERGDLFEDLCSGQITFTNTGTEALGNIHYRTYYISETGVVHQDSIIDAVIEKVIQPGQSRTVELEKFLVPVDCTRAGITIVSCDVLSQLTSARRVMVRPPDNETIHGAEAKLQQAWDRLPKAKRDTLIDNQRRWIKYKDSLSGDSKLAEIENRITYLGIQ